VKVTKRNKHFRDDNRLKIIGVNIRKYRLAKGLTQNDLAFSCGDKDWSQISRMERGLVNFSISYLFLVAEMLEVSPESLFSSNNLE
jgi:transcriptional regulator with XRE-family HTH domain